MPSYTLEIIVQGKDKATGVLRGVGGALGSLGKAAGIAGGLTVAGIGMAGGAFLKLAADAAPLEGIESAFRGLAESSGKSMEETLSALVRGSSGMVAQSELMRTYNEAAQLVGVTFADQLPEAMGYLSKVAGATGQDMGYMLDSLTKGVGRMSPMILDNLGIQVSLSEATDRAAEMFGVEADELTKAQQQAGMMNVVLEKLAANTAAMPSVTDSAQAKMARFGATVQNAKDRIGKALLPILLQLMTGLASLAERYLPPLLAAFETDFVPFLQTQVIPVLERLFQFLGTFLPQAFSLVGAAVSAAAGFFTGTLLPAIQTAIAWIEENGPKIVEALTGAFNTVIGIVGPIISEIVALFQTVLGGAITWVQENWPLIQETISDTFNTISTIVQTVLETISGFISTHSTTIQSIIRTAWNVIKIIVDTAINGVLGIIETIMNIISGNWDEAWESLKTTVGTIWEGVKSATLTAGSTLWRLVTAIAEKLPEIVLGVGEALWNAGKKIIEKLWDGLKEKLKEVEEWFKEQIGKLTSWLPFSEPKAGPASPLYGLSKAGEAIGENILKGLRVSMPKLQSEFAGGLATMGGAAGGVVNQYGGHTFSSTYNVYNPLAAALLAERERRQRFELLNKRM